MSYPELNISPELKLAQNTTFQVKNIKNHDIKGIKFILAEQYQINNRGTIGLYFLDVIFPEQSKIFEINHYDSIITIQDCMIYQYYDSAGSIDAGIRIMQDPTSEEFLGNTFINLLRITVE